MSKIVKKTEIELKNIIEQAVKKAVSNGALPEAEMPQFNIEKPANKDNGDYSTNVAMAGARAFKKAPRMIAEAIVSCIDLDGTAFDRVEIAVPGFMNFFLSQQFYSNVLKETFFLRQGLRQERLRSGQKGACGICICQPDRPYAYRQCPWRCNRRLPCKRT